MFIAEMDQANERRPREERFPVIFMCEMLEGVHSRGSGLMSVQAAA